jgi:hypothetical protein
MNESVARFRAEYRAAEIPPYYVGPAHFAFTLTLAVAGIVVCAAQVSAPTPWEWLAVPATILYANLAEYWGHRIPMHHPVAGMKLIYRRHAGQHHRFFTHEAMKLDDWRDLKAVLFPVLLVAFFFLGFGAPVALAVAWLTTPNAAWLFAATAIAYFLNYELLHLAYHLPPTHWWARFPGIARLRRLHHAHHDPSLMTRYNFNITYPIGDWLFGTRFKGSSQ